MKTLRQRPVSITNSRWTAYAAAGAASALAGVSSADADIHHVTVNEPVSGAPVDFNAFFIDGAPPPIVGFSFIHHASFRNGFAGFYLGLTSVGAMFRGSVNGPFRYPSRMLSNVNVSTGGAFVANNGTYFATLASYQYNGGQWLAAGPGYIGFKFDNGGGVQYGWIQLVMNGNSAGGNSFTVVDYAWGDPGTPIKTGQTAIPEPGSLGLLAFGAVGLLVWRQKRAKSEAQS